MSSPFANGSALAQPGRPYAPPMPAPTIQPADQYWRQSATNLSREDASIQRDLDRERRLLRGRDLAGFVQRDRRAELDGPRFSWEQTRAPSWPSELPQHIRQAVDQVVTADRAARAALAAAEQAFTIWAQQHPTASQELRRIEYERVTIDPIQVATRAAAQLDRVLVGVAGIVEAIEHRQQVEAEAPRLVVAEKRRHTQAIAQIDQAVTDARMAAQSAIAQF